VSVTPSSPVVAQGQKTRVTVTLTDVGHSSITLPRKGVADFTLSDGNTTVWHRAVSAKSVRPRVLRPGQSINLSAVWHGRAHAAGATLAAGIYTLTASDGGYSGSTTVRLA
jgi:hypothetical protein